MPIFALRPTLCSLLLSVLLGLLLAAGALAAELPVPRLAARVTDTTGTLSAEQQRTLEAKLAAFEQSKGSQLAVLIVGSVKPETVEQYALRVVEAWKLGRKGIDDGVLLLVAKDDRRLRIEVGYGLEGAVNDATGKRIISETISPRFKQGDFFGGIDAGVDALLKVIGGEPLPAPAAASGQQSGDANLEMLLFGAFVLVVVVGGVLRAMFGRFAAAGIVGVVAGIIASLLLSSLLIAALIGVAGFIAALILGASGSRGLPIGIPWGGGGSGGGGGGGGGGGFSGGGGSFGGGGASGDW